MKQTKTQEEKEEGRQEEKRRKSQGILEERWKVKNKLGRGTIPKNPKTKQNKKRWSMGKRGMGAKCEMDTLKLLSFQTAVRIELCLHTTKDGCWAFGILVLQDCASPISLTLAPFSLNLL